jgi:hypothetical protein
VFKTGVISTVVSVKRLSIVLDGGNWSLTSASGSGPAFRIVIKGKSTLSYINNKYTISQMKKKE